MPDWQPGKLPDIRLEDADGPGQKQGSSRYWRSRGTWKSGSSALGKRRGKGVVTDVDEASIQRVVEEIRAARDIASCIRHDVSSEDSWRAVIGRARGNRESLPMQAPAARRDRSQPQKDSDRDG